jgi:hypothetical protein
MRRHRSQSKKLSEAEKRRRADQRQQAIAATIPRLLYSREQTRHALGGVSLATVQRLEQRGLLDKVRLAGSASGAVFHHAWQVQALAQGGGHAD